MTLGSHAVDGAEVTTNAVLTILGVTLTLMVLRPLAQLFVTLATALVVSVFRLSKTAYTLEPRRRWQMALLCFLAWTALMAGVFFGRIMK